MLFNSFAFVFGFLPLTLAVFFGIARHLGPRAAAAWLALASLVFYGWWNPKFVALLLASIAFNFAAGRAIAAAEGAPRAKPLLAGAIAADLALLGVFKYADFFIANVNDAAGTGLGFAELVLPLGISFFTFTQIAFLVDVSRGLVREFSAVHYLLFVTWFPHLIAGPVIHHAQVMPQFARPATYRPDPSGIALGLTMFVLGLAKKVLLADTFGAHAGPVFDAARDGVQPAPVAAWSGAVAYTLQLYFDFSGYSDMACGLSLMFGVRMPVNFYSPYKAWNIIEFWRRWHMTLSQFLRDYLYVPLGGNRRGALRRYVNLLVTMLLGGLWHGASWNFVVWGGAHGLMLLVVHAWHALRRRMGLPARAVPRGAGRVTGASLTLVAVVLTWIPFRAADLPSAGRMFAGLADLAAWPSPGRLVDALARWPSIAIDWLWSGLPPTLAEIGDAASLPLLAGGLAIVLFAPNVAQLAGADAAWSEAGRAPAALSRAGWRESRGWALAGGLLLGLVLLNLSRVSPFLYFQF